MYITKIFTLGEAMKAHVGRRYIALIVVVATVLTAV
jgi:hypothetical protein